jgi:hypothetical protein
MIMGRKSRKEEITRAVREYLAMAEHRLPDEWIIDVKHVAAAVGASRTSLYAYDLAEEITAAARRQRERSGLSGEAVHRRRLRDQVRQLRQKLAQADERNKALLAHLAIIETNAARLGLDPEELYRLPAKPVRSVSHAGRGHRRR